MVLVRVGWGRLGLVGAGWGWSCLQVEADFDKCRRETRNVAEYIRKAKTRKGKLVRATQPNLHGEIRGEGMQAAVDGDADRVHRFM